MAASKHPSPLSIQERQLNVLKAENERLKTKLAQMELAQKSTDQAASSGSLTDGVKITSELYSHALTFRFTPTEGQQIARSARLRGITVATFGRNAVLAATAPRAWTSSQLRAIQAEATSTGHLWSIEELQARRLPLFWNEEWVREQLRQGRSPAEIAELAGGWSVRNANHHILNTFGIRLRQPQLDQATKTYIRDQVAAGRSRLEVADELRISRHLVLYHSSDLPTERDRQFERRADIVGRWPATTQEIATALFNGNGNRASTWCRDMVKAGRLERIRHGVYARLAPLPQRASAPAL